MDLNKILRRYSAACFILLLFINLIVFYLIIKLGGTQSFYDVWKFNYIKYAEYILWFGSPVLFGISAYGKLRLFRTLVYSLVATLMAIIPLLLSNKIIS